MMTEEKKQELTGMGFDVEDALNRFMNKENLYEKFLLRFSSDPNFSLLVDSVNNNNKEEAFNAAHTLKGICLNLGFSQLTEDVVNITEILRAGKLEGTDELFSKIQTTYENTVAEIKKLD